MGIFYLSVFIFFVFYVREINLVSVGMFFFVVYVLVIILICLMFGKFFDVKGEKYVMYLSYFFLVVGLVVFSIVILSFVLFILGGFIGLGYGMFMLNG